MIKKIIVLSLLVNYAHANPCPFTEIEIFKDGSNTVEKIGKECKLLDTKLLIEETKISTAKILKEKIKQRFEDFSALDLYYHANKKDIAKSKDVLKECTIDNVKDIDKNPKCKNTKYLKNLFGTESLREGLRSLYSQIRGNEKLMCPLEKGSTTSMLSMIMSSKNKNNYIKAIEDNSPELASYFPIYKFLKDEKKSDYSKKLLQGIQSKSEQGRDQYIDSFLQEEQYIYDLSSNLSNSCKDLFDQIREFSCKENKIFPESKEKISNLLEKSEKLTDDEKAKIGCISNLANRDNPDSFYDKLKFDLRPDKSDKNKEIEKVQNNLLCSHYNCSSDKAKNTDSCKAGGPLSAVDLKKYCNDQDSLGDNSDPDLTCDALDKNFITFLEYYEKDHPKKMQSTLADTNGKSSTDAASSDINKGDKKESSMSNFSMNFLGVEGTLIAEGKPLTRENIEEKSAEFKSVGLNPTRDSGSKLGVANAVQVPTQTAFNQPVNNFENTQQYISNNVSSSSINDAVSDNVLRSPKKSSPTTSSRTVLNENFIAGTSNKKTDHDETSSLRNQLEEMVKNMMGSSDKEKMNTVMDNNSSLTNAKLSNNSGLNEIERRNLEDYRRRLQTWEDRLRKEEFDSFTRPNNFNDAVVASQKLGQNVGQVGSSSGSSFNKGSSSPKGGISLKTAGSDNSTAEVDSSDMAKLDKDSLVKSGLNMNSSFFIKIKHNNKMVDIAVKVFKIDGKEILVPLLNSKNKELNTVILSSPLFKDYINLQKARELEREQFQGAI